MFLLSRLSAETRFVAGRPVVARTFAGAKIPLHSVVTVADGCPLATGCPWTARLAGTGASGAAAGLLRNPISAERG